MCAAERRFRTSVVEDAVEVMATRDDDPLRDNEDVLSVLQQPERSLDVASHYSPLRGFQGFRNRFPRRVLAGEELDYEVQEYFESLHEKQGQINDAIEDGAVAEKPVPSVQQEVEDKLGRYITHYKTTAQYIAGVLVDFAELRCSGTTYRNIEDMTKWGVDAVDYYMSAAEYYNQFRINKFLIRFPHTPFSPSVCQGFPSYFYPGQVATFVSFYCIYFSFLFLFCFSFYYYLYLFRFVLFFRANLL